MEKMGRIEIRLPRNIECRSFCEALAQLGSAVYPISLLGRESYGIITSHLDRTSCTYSAKLEATTKSDGGVPRQIPTSRYGLADSACKETRAANKGVLTFSKTVPGL